MKIKILSIIILVFIMSLSIISCSPRMVAKPCPKSPYGGGIYEATFYNDNESYVVTSQDCPVIEGDYVVITNYWWQEWNEDGGEEWIRYENEFYRMIVPLGEIKSVEIIYMRDKNTNAHVIDTWNWDKDK
jgi:hypothetical protein